LMVLTPLKVTIENMPDGEVIWIEKPLHPKVPELGTSKIPFAKHIYIDKDDFRTVDSKDYFRLAPNKTVGLFQAPHPITCTSFKTDPATGEVTELICRLEHGKGGKVPAKPKAFIQWVAEIPEVGSPVRIDETRVFHRLFKSDNPAAAEPDFRADINPNSLEVVKGAMVEVGFWDLAKKAYEDAKKESKERTEAARKTNSGSDHTLDGTPVATSEQLVGNECVRFQGLRVAYFALDKDAKVASLDEAGDAKPGRRASDYIVLNRIVSLKEDSGKSA